MVKVDSNGMTKGERNQLQRKTLESSLRKDRAESYKENFIIKEHHEGRENIFYPDNEVYTFHPTDVTYDKYFRNDWIFNQANDGELFVLVTNRTRYRWSCEFYNPYGFKNYTKINGYKSAKMDYYNQLYQFDMLVKRGEGKERKIRLIKKGHYIIELEHYSDIKKALNLTRKVNKFLLYDMVAIKRHCVPLVYTEEGRKEFGCKYSKPTFSFDYGNNFFNEDPLPNNYAVVRRQKRIYKKFNKLAKIRVINQ